MALRPQMAQWNWPTHETLEEEAASDVVGVGLSEQGRDRVLREVPAGGRLPADGSAEGDAVVAPATAVLALGVGVRTVVDAVEDAFEL